MLNAAAQRSRRWYAAAVLEVSKSAASTALMAYGQVRFAVLFS